MKKFIIALVSIFALMSCKDHNELVLKYGDMYLEDIKFANEYYERVDSLINVSYGHEEWPFEKKHEERLENLKVLEASYDYAQFRFDYYTTKGLKKVVDKCIGDWNYYPYVGKYHTYMITRKPSKKGCVHGGFIDIID